MPRSRHCALEIRSSRRRWTWISRCPAQGSHKQTTESAVRLEDKLLKTLPCLHPAPKRGYCLHEAGRRNAEAHPQVKDGFCGMTIKGMYYEEKLTPVNGCWRPARSCPRPGAVEIGSYRGFPMELSFSTPSQPVRDCLQGPVHQPCVPGHRRPGQHHPSGQCPGQLPGTD